MSGEGFDLNLIVDDSRPTLNERPTNQRAADILPSSESEADDDEIEDEDEPYEDAFQDVEMNQNARRTRKALSKAVTRCTFVFSENLFRRKSF